ncbi:Hypothetical_protein [Hexamita inflata]|uniref:Hypothetical_protein n=1 Tax=Hexamita inflata TaxID=28002 RepID=A0AA86RLU6_9EUKA|nr:Hypothetical protein HINF_LOCUS56470 [Hexamita inflata]
MEKKLSSSAEKLLGAAARIGMNAFASLLLPPPFLLSVLACPCSSGSRFSDSKVQKMFMQTLNDGKSTESEFQIIIYYKNAQSNHPIRHASRRTSGITRLSPQVLLLTSEVIFVTIFGMNLGTIVSAATRIASKFRAGNNDSLISFFLFRLTYSFGLQFMNNGLCINQMLNMINVNIYIQPVLKVERLACESPCFAFESLNEVCLCRLEEVIYIYIYKIKFYSLQLIVFMYICNLEQFTNSDRWVRLWRNAYILISSVQDVMDIQVSFVSTFAFSCEVELYILYHSSVTCLANFLNFSVNG